jgi:protein-S-isoprenylcysteine O-methyltransferase Ste14
MRPPPPPASAHPTPRDPADRRTAGVIAPPPLLPLAVLLLAEALRWWQPVPMPGALAWRLLLAAIVGGGALLVVVWAVRELRRARTPVEPWKATRTIVATGPYAWSRNPIYVAFLGVQLAWAWGRGDAWPLLLLPLTIILLGWGVIGREERYLAARFGAPYDAYRQRVRRWI